MIVHKSSSENFKLLSCEWKQTKAETNRGGGGEIKTIQALT